MAWAFGVFILKSQNRANAPNWMPQMECTGWGADLP